MSHETGRSSKAIAARKRSAVFVLALMLLFAIAASAFAQVYVDGGGFSPSYAPYTVTAVPYAPYTAGPVVHEVPYAPYTPPAEVRYAPHLMQ
jgi:hypothetical protein